MQKLYSVCRPARVTLLAACLFVSSALATPTVTNIAPVVGTPYAATLSGDLTATNASATKTTTYLLFDYTDKGTTSIALWGGKIKVSTNASLGVYSKIVSNLPDGIEFYFRAAATDLAGNTNIAAAVTNFICTGGGYPGTVQTYPKFYMDASGTNVLYITGSTTNQVSTAAALAILSGTVNGKVTTNAATVKLVLNDGSSLTNLPSDGSKQGTNATLDKLIIHDGSSLTNLTTAGMTSSTIQLLAVSGSTTSTVTLTVTNGLLKAVQ